MPEIVIQIQEPFVACLRVEMCSNQLKFCVYYHRIRLLIHFLSFYVNSFQRRLPTDRWPSPH